MPQIYRDIISPEITEGVMGDPTCASAESGEKFFNAIVDRISQFISDFASDKIDKYVILK